MTSIGIEIIIAIIGAITTISAYLFAKRKTNAEADSITISSAKDLFETYRHQISDLEARMDRISERNNALIEQNTALIQQNSELTKMYAELNEKYNQLERNHTQCNDKYMEMQVELEALLQIMQNRGIHIDLKLEGKAHPKKGRAK